MPGLKRTAAAIAFLALIVAPEALAAGNPEVAALQVGLRARGFYGGSVDGVLGHGTVSAVKRLQRAAGITVDGVPGARTRRALGRYARPAPLGTRLLQTRMRGWDVAALQFSLAWHGFPSGNLDGRFGLSTARALRKFQRWAGVLADGVAGASVVAALKQPVPACPLRLVAPFAGPYTDRFGPRGNRFHAGLDYPAETGATVTAAAAGRVAFVGWWAGGWGKLVTIDHGAGVRTWYAHLSRFAVRRGQLVVAGQRIGAVGATGRATGPHLHFEVRLRGAAVDPLASL